MRPAARASSLPRSRSAEVHAVRVERERRLDVVVDDERNPCLARDVGDRPAALDEVERAQTLDPQLDDGRAALRGDPARRPRPRRCSATSRLFDVSHVGRATPASARTARRRGARGTCPGLARRCAASSAATPNAASANAAASTGASAPNRCEAAGDRGRHAARAGDRREQRIAVRDGERARAVGDVVDRARHRGDDAEARSRRCARSSAPPSRLRSPRRRGSRPAARRAPRSRLRCRARSRRRPRRGSASRCPCETSSRRRRPDRARPARRRRSPPSRRAASRRSSGARACRC